MDNELKTHRFADFFVWVYSVLGGYKRKSVARAIYWILFRLEGGQYRSRTARQLIAGDYGTQIGAHSYGECFMPGAFSPSVVVGRYVSVGRDVKVFTQNHPLGWVTTHPYFYERQFGYISRDMLEPATTEIEHDVWIGHGAIILPGCKKIGTGAVIGAGAMVTKDVPPYAIVAGNPAKILRYRFSEQVRERLLASEWWNRPPEALAEYRDFMCSACDAAADDHSFWQRS